MLSWIFRHRQRLIAIYGMAPAPVLPGSRSWAPEQKPAPTRGPQRPGQLARSGRNLELWPMPPRVR